MNVGASANSSRVLVVACLNALAALALMMWSLFEPHPLQVIAAMSVGQVLGTLSFVLYLSVVAVDLRRRSRSTPSAGASDQTAP
jgi:hypothetical protein